MRVPIHLAVLRRLIAAPLLLSTAMAFGYARAPQPNLRISLDSLGFEKLTQEFLMRSSSMLTLDFVDNQHLLLTFEARGLLRRIPGDPPDDQDRNIRALLLELPSGHVLAHTDWRTHDRGQYLWNLGRGHFLLRIRDTLTTFAPLANLSTGDAFHQQPFLEAAGRHIGALMLTPEADVLTVETRSLASSATSSSDTRGSDQPADPDPIQINFYRIDNSGDAIHASYAGAGRAQAYGSFPLTGAGYLQILDQGHKRWAFNFDTFAGQVWELSYFDSTCRPSPIFVSRGEFVAFGCHNTPNPQIIGGFNMRGEETWQQGIFGDYIHPHVASSPASGRFALARILTTSPFADTETLIPEALSSQPVVVFQASSGRQVLKVDCSPIVPAGQNFALSPDGLRLAIIADGDVEIYQLPPLTAKELTDLNLVQSSSPKPTELPVRFASPATTPAASDQAAAPAQPAAVQTSTPVTTPAPSAPSAQSSTPPAPSPAAPTPASKTAAAAQPQTSQPPSNSENASGDQQSDQPRKPPTLYTLPTDPPHNQPQSK